MDKILLGSIIQRLDASDLDPSVDLLVLAACAGTRAAPAGAR